MEKICPVGLGGYLDTIGGAEHGGGVKCSRIEDLLLLGEINS